MNEEDDRAMAVQLSEAAQARIAQLIERYPTTRAVMLPALHLATQEFPYLDDEVCQAVADLLQVPMVDVKGVATFYTMFPTEPQGACEVQICFNLSCSLKGARRLLRHAESRLGIEVGQTTPDGRFTLRGVECMAACDRAPMLYMNEELHGNVSEDMLDDLLQRMSGGE
ncbi:MAG: NAD(P)H-dependent oxidoreductase subunit E [Candidatus Tectomicrobia bacterium]|nr:NAD(P)H-dependent oxidoreductase subunit E [Candidatus Tectomicrobia bacterium]